MKDKECIRQGFVFYSSAWESVQALKEQNPELAYQLLEAIIEYGLYGEYDESNCIINSIMPGIKVGIDKAAGRYEAASIGGKKGGSREKYDKDEIRRLLDKGKSHKEIAALLGCSTKTVQRVGHKVDMSTMSDKFVF